MIISDTRMDTNRLQTVYMSVYSALCTMTFTVSNATIETIPLIIATEQSIMKRNISLKECWLFQPLASHITNTHYIMVRMRGNLYSRWLCSLLLGMRIETAIDLFIRSIPPTLTSPFFWKLIVLDLSRCF